jgi:hypothetical protein
MYEFIVLGLIPGTNTELTFSVWLKIAGALLGLTVMWRMHRLHVLRGWLVTLSLWHMAHHRPFQSSGQATRLRA